MIYLKKEKAYKDVTKEWLAKPKSNKKIILFDKEFIDDFGIKHPIKNKEKSHYAQMDSEEYRIALLLMNIFGGEIHMVPRITDISNTGLSTPTPDYIWNGDKWDLKTPGIDGKFENTFERFVKKKMQGFKLKILLFITLTFQIEVELKLYQLSIIHYVIPIDIGLKMS